MSRDMVAEAVLAELSDSRHMSARDARSLAEAVADRLRLDDIDAGEIAVGMCFDLRREQDYVYPNGKNKCKMRGRRPVMRKPAEIDTLVIHQTACEFGVSRRAVRAAGGDVELARARRALDVACHVMSYRRGYFVASHPFRAYVNGAGRLNPRAVHLEVEGRYPGLLDDPETLPREDLQTTWGGAPSEFTGDTYEGACAAVDFMVRQCAAEGIKLKYVAPHRISSDKRRSDPGEEIWRSVALGYAYEKHGLKPQRESRWNQGRPVPVAWDPDGIGEY